MAIYQPRFYATTGHRGAYHEPLQPSQDDIPAGRKLTARTTYSSDATILHHAEATAKPRTPRPMQVHMQANRRYLKTLAAVTQEEGLVGVAAQSVAQRHVWGETPKRPSTAPALQSRGVLAGKAREQPKLTLERSTTASTPRLRRTTPSVPSHVVRPSTARSSIDGSRPRSGPHPVDHVKANMALAALAPPARPAAAQAVEPWKLSRFDKIAPRVRRT